MTDFDLTAIGIVCIGIGAAIIIAAAASGLFRSPTVPTEDAPRRRMSDDEVRVRFPYLFDRIRGKTPRYKA